MQKEKMLTASNFYKHEFQGIGSASIAIIDERALISITDAANLIRKERKHLIKWLLSNRSTILHAAKEGEIDYITAIFFDDFIDFCIHERDVADNQNSVIFLTHLLEKENVA